MNTEIAIITDSASDLTPDYIAKNNIHVLPLRIIFSDGEYRCGVDITHEEIYKKFETEVPTTTLPNPHDVEAIFNKLRELGIKKALFILLSSALSGTFNMVRLVCEEVKDIAIEIYDTKFLSCPEGYYVDNAIKLAKNGCDIGSFTAELDKKRSTIDGFFCVPTLDYLMKGGRIGLVAGTVGKLLNLKPIIGVNANGVYYTRAKAPGMRKSISKMIDMSKEFINGHKFDITVMHGNALAEAERILEEICAIPGLISKQIVPLGPALSVHCGPGMLGIALRTY